MRGKFIVFDGPDGSGKSSHAECLGYWLEAEGRHVVLTKEPGDKNIPLCAAIRGLLLHQGDVTPHAETLLFFAERAHHVRSFVSQKISEGYIVISDRFSGSTWAYQGYARGVMDWELFAQMTDFATNGLQPDLTIWLDVDERICLERKRAQKDENRFELEGLDFQRRVREGFREFFAKTNIPHIRLMTDRARDEVKKDIRRTVGELLGIQISGA